MKDRFRRTVDYDFNSLPVAGTVNVSGYHQILSRVDLTTGSERREPIDRDAALAYIRRARAGDPLSPPGKPASLRVA
jgi:hypothetical protein